MALHPNCHNLKGKVFGRLTVISPTHHKGRMAWECVCICGKNIVVVSKTLVNGDTKSCGCYSIECRSKRLKTHDKSNTKAYFCWRNMINRCNWKKSKSYVDYGGRGISISKDWNKFENFYRDMGTPPEGMQIDRIDNDSNYSKSNCRWVTRKDNARNKRNNIKIRWNGKIKLLIDWAKELGIKRTTISMRIKRIVKKMERIYANN